MGEYNGSVTTAGSYDPYTGNAKRFVDDLTVTGSVGAYPLKWTRVLNTRGGGGAFGEGGGWRHSYQWALSLWPIAYSINPACPPPEDITARVYYPDGRIMDLRAEPEPTPHYMAVGGVEPTGDRLVHVEGTPSFDEGDYDLKLKDGGTVEFRHMPWGLVATRIIDPYGLTTELIPDPDTHRLWKIKEPAGRYLEIHYLEYPNNHTVIKSVTSNDGIEGHPAIETVTYDYESASAWSGWAWLTFYNLIHANYQGDEDDPHPRATYHYDDPRTIDGDSSHIGAGVLLTCDDPRFAGAMSKIEYEYATFADLGLRPARGQINAEKNPTTGQFISKVTYPRYSQNPSLACQPTQACWWERTETRADGATRIFKYEPDLAELKSYTDFANPNNPNEVHHTTIITYSGAGMPRVPTPSGYYHRTVMDALLHPTATEKELNIGAVMAVIHPNQSRIEYTYTSPVDPYYLATKTDENGKITRYIRYESGLNKNRVWRIQYPDDGWEEFIYNDFGQVLTHRRATDAPFSDHQAFDHFQYDERGRLTKRWNATPSATYPPSSDVPYSRFVYYDSGPSTDRVHFAYDQLNHSTEFWYDTRGNVTRTIHEGGSYSQSKYKADGTLEWTADENHPNADRKTSFLYDPYKRVISVTNPEGETITTSYDPNHGDGPDDLSLTHTTLSVYQTKSHLQKKTNYEFDSNFRRTKIIQAPGTPNDEAITEFFYDAVGNLQSTKDARPEHYVTTFGYDDRNRQTSVKSEALNETTRMDYDDVGNKLYEIRPDGTLRSWDYDPMNRLWHAYEWRPAGTWPAANQTTTYIHDIAGNVQSIKDTKGAIYEYAYDLMNRKISQKYPVDDPLTQVNPTEGYAYDDVGNLILVRTPANQYKQFHYDGRNRQDHSWWDNNVGPNVSTQYDDASRVTGIFANSGTGGAFVPNTATAETSIVFHYDHANRKTWEDQTLAGHPTRRVKTPPDDDGNRESLTIVDPVQEGEATIFSPEMSGSGMYSVTYHYTPRNQLENLIGENGTWSYHYVYDRNGNMTTRQAAHDNGVITSTGCPAYDARNRPLSWEQYSSAPSAGGRFSNSTIKYDKANREKAIWRDEDSGRGERFEYTPTGQLANAWYNALNVDSPAPTDATRTVNYAYRPDMLNRSSVTENGVTTNYDQPTAINQYTQVGNTTYQYDANFNLTHAEGFNGVYDAANRLVSASSDSSQTVASFVYDGLGRCVKRTVNGLETILIYDGWKAIAEWDGWADYFRAWNVYGPGEDEILLRQQGKQGYIRFGLDAHGNVAFLVDNDGAVVEKITYDAFGKQMITGALNDVRTASYYAQHFMFQGRECLDELGIYDYRHRFYHPGLGRFLQSDPTGFDAGDMNLFRYCGDDPVDGSDPMGLVSSGTPFLRDFMWLFAKYGDPANISQGLFADQTKGSFLGKDVEGGDKSGDRGSKSVSAGSEGPKKEPFVKTTAEYKGGQAAIKEAQRFLRAEHPELKPDKYRVFDIRIPRFLGMNGFAPIGNRFLILDTRTMTSYREVVRSLAHELMHMTDGLRTLLPGRHAEIYSRSETISQEYFYGK
ncbi:MAG: RHS repeat-associated core domain-containing protein [Chthoniobacterales bacterium]